jgi:hypothetical protein
VLAASEVESAIQFVQDVLFSSENLPATQSVHTELSAYFPAAQAVQGPNAGPSCPTGHPHSEIEMALPEVSVS